MWKILMISVFVLMAACTPAITESDDEIDVNELPVDDPRAPKDLNDPLGAYFLDSLAGPIRATHGQPIEGFEPQMFLDAYPKLIEQDFDGTQAEQGVYRYDGEQLVYDHLEPTEHSAARALTPRGMSIVLENIARRHEILVHSQEDVDAIVLLIS